MPSCEKQTTISFSHFASIHVLGSHHEVIFNMLATVLAVAVKVVLLLQHSLALGRQIQEVHIAHSELHTLRDFLQGTQLNPTKYKQA